MMVQDDLNRFNMSLRGTCVESLDVHMSEMGMFETPMDWVKRRRLYEVMS